MNGLVVCVFVLGLTLRYRGQYFPFSFSVAFSVPRVPHIYRNRCDSYLTCMSPTQPPHISIQRVSHLLSPTLPTCRFSLWFIQTVAGLLENIKHSLTQLHRNSDQWAIISYSLIKGVLILFTHLLFFLSYIKFQDTFLCLNVFCH